MVLGAESRAPGDVAIDMMDSRTSQQLQLIDEQVPGLPAGEEVLLCPPLWATRKSWNVS